MKARWFWLITAVCINATASAADPPRTRQEPGVFSGDEGAAIFSTDKDKQAELARRKAAADAAALQRDMQAFRDWKETTKGSAEYREFQEFREYLDWRQWQEHRAREARRPKQ